MLYLNLVHKSDEPFLILTSNDTNISGKVDEDNEPTAFKNGQPNSKLETQHKSSHLSKNEFNDVFDKNVGTDNENGKSKEHKDEKYKIFNEDYQDNLMDEIFIV